MEDKREKRRKLRLRRRKKTVEDNVIEVTKGFSETNREQKNLRKDGNNEKKKVVSQPE